MIARFSGGVLGLLAFGLAMVSGLVVGNSAEVILSRALWALAVFCVIGLVVGAAAQVVVGEYTAQKINALFPSDNASPEGGEKDKSIPSKTQSMGTEGGSHRD